MSTKKSSFWIVLASFASIAVLAVGWLVMVSPTMATAADARGQADQQRASNDALNLQLTKLAEQFTHLDEYKAGLAALRVQVPAKPDLVALNTELQALATSTGVTLTTITANVAEPFTTAVAAPAAAPAAPAEGAATTTEVPAPAAAAKGATAGMFDVPLSLTLMGTYDQVTAFISSFQTGSQRLFLAATIDAQSQPATGASGGKPPLAKGDLLLTLTGFAYVLTDPSAVVPPAPATPPALPQPSGQKNPFLPIG